MFMKNGILNWMAILLMILSMLPIHTFASQVDNVVAPTATFSDFNIVLSNINKTGATISSPGTLTTKSIVGKAVSPGYAMIKLSDLQYLGATTQVIGNNYYVYINGQTIVFTKDSTYYSSTTSYTINKPAGGTQSYTFSVNGNTETNAQAQLIDNAPYVRLTDAVHQSGALIVNYNNADNTTYVFHFRVNGSNPHSDSNIYGYSQFCMGNLNL